MTDLTPAERELERAKQALREEEAYQARMQRQAELQGLRTEGFIKDKEQGQRVADTILGNLHLILEVRGEVREAKINLGLIPRPGIIRGHFWSVEASGCQQFNTLPEELGRIHELVEAVGHPRDLPSFRGKGRQYCSRHHSNHLFVLSFKGLKLSELGLEPCVCAPGGAGHKFKNVSRSNLSSAPWRFEPGESFECPPGAEEDLEKYLSIGYVEDLKAPKKVQKEKAKAKPKTPQEILEEAISHWERNG